MFTRPFDNTILLPFLIAFLSCALLTPLTIILFRKVGLIDDPKRSNHPAIIHAKPIPRGGGIALFLGTLIPALIFIPFTKQISALFTASFIALCIGILDDTLNARSKDVSPYVRFLINIFSAVIVVGSGITISFVTNPFTGGILHLDRIIIPLGITSVALSTVVSIIWITWVMNMLNWSKGVDGQMPGVVAIASVVIGILSLRFTVLDPSNLIEAQLSFIIAGSALGFLLYNFYPSRIFPGYGATSVYLLLAVVGILSSAKLATELLVIGVPIIDGAFTIVRRVLAKKSPLKGDRGHLHHLLLDLGYSQRQIAAFYWIITALLGTLALTVRSESKVFALITVTVIITGALLFLHFIVRYTHEKERS